MGVPAFFRWLSRKYASIVVHCVEEKGDTVDGVDVPIDWSKPNPNDTEFDNLYLDMNGIIHPCCHPENKPAPKNEDEMMVDIFDYIDRILAICRPRKVLYMAIDGVAPRAKMNQQRSRRFRASQEGEEKRRDVARIKAELRAKGAEVPPDKPAEEHFDSNCITPGTPFMFRLADCLRYYVHDRLNKDPGWKDLKVILSDANVPGEGEHKIMDYIRRQRAQPDHDPNTHHCLCGADADLIMLGLATHEPNFTIIREEFKPNQPRACDICGQYGHEMKECTGAAKEKSGEFDEVGENMGAEVEFIFIRLNVLREYLERELSMPGLPFKQDMERAIDDWVFMCFFVGNDFLPHLPSLEIREGAIDRLINIYKKTVHKTGGYLTKNGIPNLARVQLVLADLGEVEDEIFKRRRDTELDFRRRNKQKKLRNRQFAERNAPKFIPGGQYTPKAIGSTPDAIQNPRLTAYQMRMQAISTTSNQSSADQLRAMLKNGSTIDTSTGGGGRGQKRTIDDVSSEEEPEDEVKLWEDGWKDRYYESKFGVESDDIEFRRKVGTEYVIGLCWVLRYYYQGCPSWKWYFPYHYAPFASDFHNVGDVSTEFEKDTEPFKPLEQLMGVFPAASKQFLPPSWQTLMYDGDSPIIDFYPEDFKVDLNGKKFAWQGVALLPFVDEIRLWAALDHVYPDLTSLENSRNIRGDDRLFVGPHHSSHAFFEGLYENGATKERVAANTSILQGLGGTVWCDEHVVLTGQSVKSPIPLCKDIPNNKAICVQFKDPQFDKDFVFLAVVLPGAKFPGKVLKPQDFDNMIRQQQIMNRGMNMTTGGRGRGGGRGGRGGYRPQLGFQPHSGYRDSDTKDSSAAQRMLRGSLSASGRGGSSGAGAYGNVPPPLMGGGGGGGSKCFKCGGQGHFARECTGSASDQGNRQQSQGRQGRQSSGYDNRSSGNRSYGSGGSSYGSSSGGRSHGSSSYGSSSYGSSSSNRSQQYGGSYGGGSSYGNVNQQSTGYYGAGSGSYGAGSGSYGTGSGSYGTGSGSYGTGSGSYGAGSGSYGGGGSYGSSGGYFGNRDSYGGQQYGGSQGYGGGGNTAVPPRDDNRQGSEYQQRPSSGGFYPVPPRRY